MQTFSLDCHPAAPTASVDAITAQVALQGRDWLLVRFRLEGKPEELRVPEPVEPARTDELWKHTCFEVFLKPSLSKRYYEFNFSPSGLWAAYLFEDYRRGMQPVAAIARPPIRATPRETGLDVEVQIGLRGLIGVGGSQTLKLGIAAVIEETNDFLSYWALAHLTSKPDFHHPDSFACAISQAEFTRG
jgi:hypothetical protein